MNRFLPLFTACVAIGFLSPQAVVAEKPALPELKPLEQFVGSWKTSMKDVELSGDAETKWILGGRFIQQTYSLSDSSQGMNLRGYDPKTKKYVMFTFDSNGTMLKQEGTWDQATKTLTVEGEVGDVVVVTKAHFPDKNTEEWSIIVQSKERNVLQTFQGKNVRTNRK